jgi:hypothetical protein
MINTLSLSYEYIFLNFSVHIQLPTFNEVLAQLRPKEARHQYQITQNYVHFQNPKTSIRHALILGIKKKCCKYNICTKDIISINL